MKNKIKIIVILMLVVLSSMVLSSCGEASQLDKFYKKMEKADSYTAVITMEASIFGKVVMTTKIDGNKQYISSILDDNEEYKEIVDGKVFIYTKNYFGEWEKELEKVDDSNDKDDDSLRKMFDSKNYDYSKKEKAFILKKDSDLDDFNGMEILSFKVIIDGETCSIEGEVVSEGMAIPITIVIKNINKTTVTLPEVK